jgi:hypothetical protein
MTSLTISLTVSSRTEAMRLIDAAYGVEQSPQLEPRALHGHRGGRRAGENPTVVLEALPDWCKALSAKAAEVVRLVASRSNPVSCIDVRKHMSQVFYAGATVSAARLGGIMANGGRSLRVNVNGELVRPIQLDQAESCYLMDPKVRAVVADILGPPMKPTPSAEGARDSTKS